MVAALIALALAAPPVTHDVVPVVVTPPGSSGGVDYAFAWTSGPPQPLRLRVFRAQRRLDDVLPPMLQGMTRFMTPPPRPSQSRLLLTSGTTRIYAYPGGNGSVCVFLYPFGGGSCPRGLMHGALPTVDVRRDVWGLLGDAAVRVDLRIGTRTYRAAVGRNAFYLRLPQGAVAPSRIVVRDRGGARHVYDVHRCTLAQVRTALPSSPLSPPGC